MTDVRLYRNSLVYLITRLPNRVIYHLHCTKHYTFELPLEEWDALPTK